MREKTKRWWFPCLIIFIGLLTYSNTLHNKALFNHPPTIYTDSLLNISLLQSYKLFPQIFTTEFSIHTLGEYRPITYALVSLLRNFTNSSNYLAWHFFLIGIQILNALIVFLILKELINKITSAFFSLLFLVHPFFSFLVNDLNKLYILLGIEFILFTLLFYTLYLKKKTLFYLLVSVFSFALSVFTFRLAILSPVFIVLLHALYAKNKQALTISFIYLSILFVFFSLGNLNLMFLFSISLILVCILSYNIYEKKEGFLHLVTHLLPYFAVVILWIFITWKVDLKPIYVYPVQQIKAALLLTPFETSFVLKNFLSYHKMYLLAIITVLCLPLFLFFDHKGWIKRGILSILVGLFIFSTMKLNSLYAGDVKYWEEINEISNNRNNIVKLNLSKAYLKEGKLRQAKKLLFHLKYEKENHGLVEDTINTELGKLYFAQQQYKLAGYYFLQKPKGCLPGAEKIDKGRLKDIGDFLFNIGFLSYAENYFACALVLDPYDLELLNRLGKVLLYKNFFRASGKYFEQVLEYDKNNDTAIYHLAFIYKTIGDEKKFKVFRKKWRELHHTKEEMDFTKVYSQYKYDKERIRQYLSSDPVVLFSFGGTDSEYLYKYRKQIYNFWEVPLEIAQYFFYQTKYKASLGYSLYSHKLNRKSKEVVECCLKNYQKLNNQEKVKEYTEMLKEMSS